MRLVQFLLIDERYMIFGIHSYALNLDNIKKRMFWMQDKLEAFARKNKAVTVQLRRKMKKNASLNQLLCNLYKQQLLAREDTLALEERFEGSQLTLIKQLLHIGHVSQYSREVREFSCMMHFYSPKAYNYLQSLFALPAMSTLRSWVSNVQALPGFSVDAMRCLRERCTSGDVNYQMAALVIDSMSLKEHVEYDNSIKRVIGYVDLGCFSQSETEELAKEALVVMLVGLRGQWKIPVAYYLVKGIYAALQAGIICGTIMMCYEFGLCVMSVTCNGTGHNLKTMNLLGASLQAGAELHAFFDHLCNSDLSIGVFLDPPHMIKLFRNMLHKFKVIKWPGHGLIKWEFFEKLNVLQEKHQLLLASKLTVAQSCRQRLLILLMVWHHLLNLLTFL